MRRARNKFVKPQSKKKGMINQQVCAEIAFSIRMLDNHCPILLEKPSNIIKKRRIPHTWRTLDTNTSNYNVRINLDNPSLPHIPCQLQPRPYAHSSSRTNEASPTICIKLASHLPFLPLINQPTPAISRLLFKHFIRV